MNNLEVIKEILTKRNLKLSVAESCTGGLISSNLTDIDGASNFIEINFVTYSPYAKIKFLGVLDETIEQYGVVSNEVALEMARGLLKYAGVTISTTGYASSNNNDPLNKKGTVYYAFGYKNITKSYKYVSQKEARKEIKEDMKEKILSDFRIFLCDLFN